MMEKRSGGSFFNGPLILLLSFGVFVLPFVEIAVGHVKLYFPGIFLQLLFDDLFALVVLFQGNEAIDVAVEIKIVFAIGLVKLFVQHTGLFKLSALVILLGQAGVLGRSKEWKP